MDQHDELPEAEEPRMLRPLWRLLLDVQGPGTTRLQPAECRALLEFLVEELVAGCGLDVLQPLMDCCLRQMPLKQWPGDAGV